MSTAGDMAPAQIMMGIVVLAGEDVEDEGGAASVGVVEAKPQ